MSMLSAVKDVVVGRAMKLVSDPRVTKMVSSPAVMNAAMKAMSLTGQVKSQADKATKLAAGVFGLATQDEISQLRTTINDLEDQVATLRTRSTTGQ
jgi:cell division protein FtsB